MPLPGQLPISAESQPADEDYSMQLRYEAGSPSSSEIEVDVPPTIEAGPSGLSNPASERTREITLQFLRDVQGVSIIDPHQSTDDDESIHLRYEED